MKKCIRMLDTEWPIRVYSPMRLAIYRMRFKPVPGEPVKNKEAIIMKKLVSLVLALMLCLSCVSALAAEAWTVTCPWAPSGVAAMVNQKAAALSTTYSQDYVLVANAEKGDTATINSWLTKYTEADPQMCFIGEGMFGITAILDPARMNFVASARKELGITSIDALKAYLEAGNQIMVGTNGATGSEAFLAAALIGAMGYGDQFCLIPYESAAEAAQAVARGEVDVAVSHQSQILETWQQGGVDVFAAFDGQPIAQGPFAGVEGVGQYGYPYFRNRCFIFAKAGADEQKVADIKALYAQILADEEMVDWLNNTMLLEADPMTEEETIAHLENVRSIVNEYYDLVAE